MIRRWKRILEARRRVREVAELRAFLTPGMRVTHVDEAGGSFQGLILKVRKYDDGQLEGFFQADTLAKAGWKPEHSFLPAETP